MKRVRAARAARLRSSQERAILTRLVGVTGAVGGLLLAGATGFVGSTATAASAASTTHTPPPTTCPSSATCETIGSGSGAPEVVVTPTTGLGAAGEGDQWIYISLYDFPPGDVASIQYCSDSPPLSVQAPLCDSSGTATFPNPSAHLPIDTEGTGSISFQVEEQDPANDTPFSGIIPGVGTAGTFYCDDSDDPCSVDVTDPSLGSPATATPTVSNTAVVPVSFSSEGAACANATQITTESDFGIGFLLPPAAAQSCSGNNPAISLNLSQDDLHAVQDVVAGNDQVAFIDDPGSPDIQQALAGGSYAFVPVAVTADVIGFKALKYDSDPESHQVYPDNSFNLTPAMAAGILSAGYSGPSNADLVPCSAIPATAALGTACQGSASGSISLVTLANPTPGFVPPQAYGTFVRADTTGLTQEVLSWICDAPAVPVAVTGGTVVDPSSAPSVLQQAFGVGGVSRPACPSSGLPSDQWPSLPDFGSTYASAVSTPNKQDEVLANLVPPPSSSDSQYVAGFAPMVWSEAEYYGLNPASLQNAAGQWVAPSQSSLDAALADATVNPDGTLTLDFDNTSDPSAYPMPDVIYAVVPAAAIGPKGQAPIISLLTSLLSVSEQPTTNLPAGFVQLPGNLYQEAVGEVGNGAPVTTGKTSPSTPAPGTGVAPSGSGNVTSTPATASPTKSASTPTPPSQSTIAFAIPVPAHFLLLASDDRWLEPGLAAALIVALLLGPGLLLGIQVRRRFATAKSKR